MANILIRNLDEALKKKLRLLAAMRGRSMEAEARDILRLGLASQKPDTAVSLADAIHRRFAPLGGVDLPPVKRGTMRSTPDFGE